MTHYDISYKGMNRTEADAKAVQDIKDYCSEKQWNALLEYAHWVEVGHKDFSFKRLKFMMQMFVGIQGYPIFAFGRTYCLKAYRAYMADDSEGGPIETDEQGFSKEEREPIKSSDSPWGYR